MIIRKITKNNKILNQIILHYLNQKDLSLLNFNRENRI
jgi:hypothetical protein